MIIRTWTFTRIGESQEGMALGTSSMYIGNIKLLEMIYKNPILLEKGRLLGLGGD